MTGFNNNLVPDLRKQEHADHARAMEALSSCSSPSAVPRRVPSRAVFIVSDVAQAVDDVLNSADGHDRSHFIGCVIAELKKVQNAGSQRQEEG